MRSNVVVPNELDQVISLFSFQVVGTFFGHNMFETSPMRCDLLVVTDSYARPKLAIHPWHADHDI